MPKLPNPRAIRATRTYTVIEAAEALGVSVGTVRGWFRDGLQAMTAQRPYLILGDMLRTFIEERRAKSKTPLMPDQLFCLSCKAGRRPLGLLVDWHQQSAATARLTGLCEVCGGSCNRMVSRAKLDQYRAIFDLAYKDRKRA